MLAAWAARTKRKTRSKHLHLQRVLSDTNSVIVCKQAHPGVEFRLDDTIEKADKVLRLIDQISEEETRNRDLLPLSWNRWFFKR